MSESQREISDVQVFALEAMEMDDVSVSRASGRVTVSLTEHVDGELDGEEILSLASEFKLEVVGVRVDVGPPVLAIEFAEREVVHHDQEVSR